MTNLATRQKFQSATAERTVHTERPARFVAVALAVVVALGLTGCSTPKLKSSVDVPNRYASADAMTTEPEIAWWESYGDPVLSELIRRAAYENRDIKVASERVRAARAGTTISRSYLFPSIGVRATGTDQRTGYGSDVKNGIPDAADAKAATYGVDVSWEVDVSGRLRAGATAAAADAIATEHDARGVRLLVITDVATNYFTLVGALRQLETVRAIAAAHEETLRLVTARAACRPRHAIRRRARADGRFDDACFDTTARNPCRRIASPHRRADRRPGVQRGQHHADAQRCARHTSRSTWTAGGTACSDGRICSRRRRNSTRLTRDGSRRTRNGFHGFS